MSTANSGPRTDVEDDLPQAHIDAQDEPYVLPLREYLETHGVTVSVNKPLGKNVMYHIAAGDGAFVESIFSRSDAQGVKKLGIMLGQHVGTGNSSHTYKKVFTDPKPLTAEEVLDIFEFFFSDDGKTLDLHRRVESRTLHEVSMGKTVHTRPRDVSSRIHEGRNAEDRERINTILADVYGHEVTGRPASRPRGSKNYRRFMFGLVIAVGLIVVPVLWYLLSLGIGGAAVANGAKALATGDMRMVSWDTQVADYWLHQGDLVIRITSTLFSWVGVEDAIRGQERLMSFLNDTVDAERLVQGMTGVGLRVAGGLINQIDVTGTGTTSVSDIVELRTTLASVQNTLGLAQAELAQLLTDKTFPFSFGYTRIKGDAAISDLVSLREASGDIDHLLSLFLQVAGFKESKTYLVLLQNSAELRPTGGFIGSVAVASFSDGRLTNLDVEDVYTFDGQLKGHVDPPGPVRDLLGQEHWYLRDSNWDPDFLEAGSRAAWFYEKETGTNVDGVVAINSSFITRILAATGPVDVPDYNDRITADNFYGKSLYYTQSNFFPGSTQKRISLER